MSTPSGGSVGLVEQKEFTFAEDHSFTFECGKPLGPLTLAYETYGELNAARDNAVLVCHALTGDAHLAGYHSGEDKKPGWWDLMVGPGKPLDTNRYFIICSNVLGGCMGSSGPTQIDPATERPFGLNFPMVTIGDMVAAQKKLVEHLGIDTLLAVIGGSMGGMQTLEWTLKYPDAMRTAVVLASTWQHTALSIAFNEVGRQAIMSDPDWNQGDYYGTSVPGHGLAVARMIGHITYLSDASMRQKFGRRLQDRCEISYGFDTDFQIQSYLQYQGRKFVDRFDANSFLYMTKACDYFNVADKWGAGSLTEAFARARAMFMVVSFTSDWLYPTSQSKEMVQAMKKNSLDVSFCEIKADCGHDAFLLPNKRLNTLMRGVMEKATRKGRTS